MRARCNRCSAPFEIGSYQPGVTQSLCAACLSRDALIGQDAAGLQLEESSEGDAVRVVLTPPRGEALKAALFGLWMALFCSIFYVSHARRELGPFMLFVDLFMLLALTIVVRSLPGLFDHATLVFERDVIQIASRPLAFWRSQRLATRDVEVVVTAVKPLIRFYGARGEYDRPEVSAAIDRYDARIRATYHARVDIALPDGSRVTTGVQLKSREAAQRVVDRLNTLRAEAAARPGTIPYRA